MSNILAILLLGLNVQGDPLQELTDIVTQAQKVQSYGFEVQTTSQGGFGRRGGSTAPAAPLLGSWQKGKPTRLESGGSVAFRDDQRAVYQDSAGAWKPLDPRAMMRGGRGGGGAGRPGGEAGERPPREEGEGERPPRGEGGQGGGQGGNRQMDPERAAMFSRLALLRARLPHAMLADLQGGVAEVTVEEAEGSKTFRGKLSPETAAKLSGSSFGGRGGRGGGGGGFGGGGPELEHSGSFSVVVGADGMIQSFEIETSSSGSFRDREIKMGRKSAVSISAVNKTEVEVPEEAAAALTAPVESEDDIF